MEHMSGAGAEEGGVMEEVSEEVSGPADVEMTEDVSGPSDVKMTEEVSGPADVEMTEALSKPVLKLSQACILPSQPFFLLN